MNYTGLVDLFDANEIDHNISPRFELCMGAKVNSGS